MEIKCLTRRQSIDSHAPIVVARFKMLNRGHERPVQANTGRSRNILPFPEFLLPQLADFHASLSAIVHNYPESVGEMAESIRQCVRRYEPRLTHVRVIYDKREEDELTLRFHIAAQVAVPGLKSRLGFDTVVTSSGRVRVKR